MSDKRARERDRLITALLGPGAPEVTCEQCFAQLDRYVDLALADAEPDRAVPGMREHLVGCPACHDDYDSLLEFVGGAGEDAPPAPL
jgi:hypothetical protein